MTAYAKRSFQETERNYSSASTRSDASVDALPAGVEVQVGDTADETLEAFDQEEHTFLYVCTKHG